MARVEEFRRGLAALAKLEPSKHALFTSGARWTEEALGAFEVKHGVTLPTGYRLYLREIGDGGAGFAFHGPCCGGIPALRKAKRAALAKLATPSTLTKAVHGIERTPKFEGCLYVGARADHCDYWLVVTGSRAGEVPPVSGKLSPPPRSGVRASHSRGA